MKRKNFLKTGLGTAALFVLAPISEAQSLSQRQPAPKKPFKITAGKGRFNEFFLYKGKNPNNIKISGKDTDNQLAVFEYIGYEKTGPSLHLHFEQDEIFYVTEGKYRFVVGEETMLLNAGDTVFLPRQIPHTWIQLSETGKMVYMVQPAGKAEEFFRTMNNLKHIPSRQETDQIHEACGMKVIGPPLSL